jgi:lipid-A-disaccharide synthase
MTSSLPLKLFFSAAEASGDLLAAALARELRALDPDVSMSGFGGRQMTEAGVELVRDLTDTSAIGLLYPVVHLPLYLRTWSTIRRLLAATKPDAAILIDAPAVNFPLARAARRLGIPTVYYVAPQSWLWNPSGAVAKLRRHVDLVVPVLSQEAALYRDAGLDVVYRGHPIVDLVHGRSRALDSATPLDRTGARPTRIGILPGSRRHEVARLLPAMLDAIRLLAGPLGPLEVAVAPASGTADDLVFRVRQRLGSLAPVSVQTGHEVLSSCDVSIAASGTVLLEAALLDAPAVMTYRLDPLTFWVGTHVVRIPDKMPHYALPNILAAERIVPELVQGDATPERLAAEVQRLLSDAQARKSLRDGYQRVRAALGTPGVTRALARDVHAWVAQRAASSGAHPGR